VQLTFDPDVEAFRAKFVAFLDEHVPATPAQALKQPKSVSHMPDWARRWPRLLFNNGWLLPTQPPEFGGRNATVLQQYVYLEELCKRRIYHSFNPQGVDIIAASLISFRSDEQKQRWAVPILRAEITASLGMSEPSAGSDLASLRTRAVRDGDHFVLNGQKVWTSGAHDADVLLTFVRTDPNAPKHKGISALGAGQVLDSQHVTVEVNTVLQQLASVLGKLDPAKLNEILGLSGRHSAVAARKSGRHSSIWIRSWRKLEPRLSALSHDIAVSAPVFKTYANTAAGPGENPEQLGDDQQVAH